MNAKELHSPDNLEAKKKKIEGIIDKVVAGYHQKYFGARDQSFDAASFDLEAFENYNPLSYAPDDENNRYARETMISRARDMYNNDVFGGGIIDRIIQITLGSKGFSLRVHLDNEILEWTDEQKKKYTNYIKRKWKRFCRKENCDITKERSLNSLLKSLQLGKLNDGDMVINLPSFRFSSDEEFGLKIQIIESERLQNLDEQDDTDDYQDGIGNVLKQGIEQDDFGRHLRYHIRKTHPNELTTIGELYSWEMLDVYDYEGKRRAFLYKSYGREGQTRGLPKLVRSMQVLKYTQNYVIHELFAAAICSLYSIFVRNVNEEEDVNHLRERKEQSEEEVIDQVLSNRFGSKADKIKLGLGNINYLHGDQDIEFADPSRPNSQFSPFVEFMMKALAGSTGIPSSYILLKFDSSYTAARADYLQVDEVSQSERTEVNEDCLGHVYSLLVDEMVEEHDDLPDFVDKERYLIDRNYREAMKGYSFIGTKLGSLNELIDVQSAGLRNDKGLSSISMEQDKMHGDIDFYTVTDELAENLAYRKEKGIVEVRTAGVLDATRGEILEKDERDKEQELIESKQPVGVEPEEG